MKTRYTRRSWLVSMLIHVCLAAICAHVISSYDLFDEGAIQIGFLYVSPITPQVRKPTLEPPKPLNIVPPPDLTPQQTANLPRSLATRHTQPIRDADVTPAQVDISPPQSRLRAKQVESRAVFKPERESAPSADTTVDLPTASESALAFGIHTDVPTLNQTHTAPNRKQSVGGVRRANNDTQQSSDGLTSLVRSSGTANIDASLAGVTGQIALGNSLPALPLDTPGAIVIGRGREIAGRLNLVRFEDPLHPDADLCGSGVGNLRFAAGLSYLVRHINQFTRIETRLVDAVTITDAAFYQSPIIFMEPIPASLIRAHSGEFTNLPAWRIRRPQGTHDYTTEDAQRLREYVVKYGGFIYMAAHGNTPESLLPAIRVLRQILPEHQLAPVQNDHELYKCYYTLNGPLRYPVRKIGNAVLHYGEYSALQGIFIDGRLAVLVDTEAMMHVLDGAAQKPFYGAYADRNSILMEFAPYAARQLTNVIIYAITHGTISDYRNYVPLPDTPDTPTEAIPSKAPYIPAKEL